MSDNNAAQILLSLLTPPYSIFNPAGPRDPFSLLTCCLVFVCLLLPAPVVSGVDLTLRVGVFQNPPKVFVNEEGKPGGVWIDLLKDMAGKEDWELIYVPGTWQETLDRLRSGEIDLAVDMALSDQRLKEFDLNQEAVLSNWTVLYGHEGMDITDIKDLKNKRIAVMKGAIEKKRFEEFHVPCTFVEVPTYKDAFLAVDRGAADAALISQFFGMANEDRHKVKRTAIMFSPLRLHFAAAKGRHREVLSAIDRRLKELKADKTSVYHQSLRKLYDYAEVKVVPPWLWYGLLIACALILTACAFVWTLRHQVRARTRELGVRQGALEQEMAQRMEAEKELEQSEKRFRLHFENASDVIYSLDSEFKILDISPSVERILGYRPEELIGKPFLDLGLLAPEDAERAVSDTMRILAGEETGAQVYVFIGKNGRRVFGEVTSCLVSSVSRGNLLISVARDVTERKMLEDRVRESEAFLRAIFESTSESIVVWDHEYDYLYANRAAIEHVGTTPEHVIGKNIRDGLGHIPDFMHLWMKRIDQVFETGEGMRVEDGVPVGDRLVYSESVVSPVRDTEGRIFAVGVVYRDVTERKRAEEDLRGLNAELEEKVEERTREVSESLDRLNAILVSVADGLVVTDHEARVMLMNPAAEALLGLKFSEAEGHPLYFAVQDHTLRDRIRTALEEREPGYQFDFEAPGDRPGHSRILRAKTAKIQTEIKDGDSMVTVISDVTGERELDRMKTEFLSTAAHELRSPLTSIRGFSELLLTRDNLPPEAQRRFVEHINRQSVNLTHIINDLLDISRIESGRGFSLRKEVFDLADLIREAALRFQGTTPSHAILAQLPETPLPISADRDKMEQILENLLSNALKYSPDGGTVRIDIEDCRLKIEDLKEGRPSTIQIRVADSGLGMTPEQIDHVFDKFWRADASNKAVEGTGLGMSIVKYIAEAHGGMVRVESEGLGKGTKVTVELKIET